MSNILKFHPRVKRPLRRCVGCEPRTRALLEHLVRIAYVANRHRKAVATLSTRRGASTPSSASLGAQS